MILVPGIRAGLNDRSQSAYAIPAPKPVESAIGHVRPGEGYSMSHEQGSGKNERLNSTTERMTPALKPTPLFRDTYQTRV